MRSTNSGTAISIIAALGILSLAARLPDGWRPYQSDPGLYLMEVDSAAGYNRAGGALRIRSVSDDTVGFGTLLQRAPMDPYRGHKLRLSGWMKARDLSGAGFLWLRINSEEKTIAYDDMAGRKLSGTRDWTYCEIVLPVDTIAWKIEYGFTLKGSGQLWADALELRVADR